MKKTLEEIKTGYSPEKQKTDTIWVKILIRKLSFYVAWVAMRCGITAFHISMFALILPVAAMIFWLTSKPFIAIILLNIWLLLDCVDGNIARSVGGNQMGDFVDATSGYMMIGFSFFGIGSYLDIISINWHGISNSGFTIIGALSSILNLLTRVYYQKYMNVLSKSDLSNDIVNPKSVIKSIDHNIGIGGFFTPLLLVSYCFDMLPLMLIFYAIYTLFYFLGISGKLLSYSKCN